MDIKKLSVFIAILMVAVIIGMIIASIAGYGLGCVVGRFRAQMELKDAPKPTPTVAVDAQSPYYGYGWLTIFTGEEFVREYNTVDYVEGDPCHLYEGDERVIGIVASVTTGWGGTVNRAVLEDGSIATLGSGYKLLPRSSEKFLLSDNNDGKQKAFMEVNTISETYKLSIVRDGLETLVVSDVSDAWVAYDTIYWLVGDVAYKLDWATDKDPEVYVEGAYAISHNSDESEGALVPYEKANYSAYGRSDIYSPYGNLNR